MQCEARRDSIASEKGLYNRGYRQGQQEGELRGKVIMCKELGLSVEDISKKLSISVDKVKEILSQ